MVTIMQVHSEDPEHTFLTPQEFADMMPGVPLSRVGSWRRTGDGPEFVKFGRTVLYTLSAVDEWMAAQTHRSTGDTLPSLGLSSVGDGARRGRHGKCS